MQRHKYLIEGSADTSPTKRKRKNVQKREKMASFCLITSFTCKHSGD